VPENKTLERDVRDEQEGEAPTTQAPEFVREEIQHIRRGKHGARSPEQAIATGPSKVRRAGVELPRRRRGTTWETTRKRAERALEKGQSKASTGSTAQWSVARIQALKREGRSAALPRSLSEHGKRAAAARKRRGPATSKITRALRSGSPAR
jgi:hypothetical protein